MQLFSWLTKHLRGKLRTRRTPARKPAARFRPQLETLEGRDVPSTLTVTSAADSGAGSLRAEIAAAQPKDTIVFSPSLAGQTITLTSGELLINKNLTIQGPGAGQLAISGNYQNNWYGPTGFRVFEVDNATVTLAGLTICNGLGQWDDSPANLNAGGGILNSGGKLTVNNCAITNNVAGYGGGIYNLAGGTLALNGCTLSGNQFTGADGLMGGGAIYNSAAQVTITNSMISDNFGPPLGTTSDDVGVFGDGGGIYNGGAMTLSGTTVTHNSAYEFGGGIYEGTGGILSILNNSNVSGNSPGGDLFLANGDTVTIKKSQVGVILY